MVALEKLVESDKGRYVWYYDQGANKGQLGRVKSWNDTVMFVVYNCGNQWNDFENYTAAATNPAHLTWSNK